MTTPIETTRKMRDAGAWVMKDLSQCAPYTHPNDVAALVYAAMERARLEEKANEKETPHTR